MRMQCKMVHPLCKAVWRFLKKLSTELPYDLAIPLTFEEVYTQKEVKAGTQTGTCMSVLQHYSQ